MLLIGVKTAEYGYKYKQTFWVTEKLQLVSAIVRQGVASACVEP